jgi:hypothetical protein
LRNQKEQFLYYSELYYFRCNTKIFGCFQLSFKILIEFCSEYHFAKKTSLTGQPNEVQLPLSQRNTLPTAGKQLKHKNNFFTKNKVSECRLCSAQYFVCDWWFNVDCSTAVSFYSLNEQIAAERAENSPPGTVVGQYKGRPATGAAKNGQTGVAAASVGGYARYCEDFSTINNNSCSIHFFHQPII